MHQNRFKALCIVASRAISKMQILAACIFFAASFSHRRILFLMPCSEWLMSLRFRFFALCSNSARPMESFQLRIPLLGAAPRSWSRNSSILPSSKTVRFRRAAVPPLANRWLTRKVSLRDAHPAESSYRSEPIPNVDGFSEMSRALTCEV